MYAFLRERVIHSSVAAASCAACAIEECRGEKRVACHVPGERMLRGFGRGADVVLVDRERLLRRVDVLMGLIVIVYLLL